MVSIHTAAALVDTERPVFMSDDFLRVELLYLFDELGDEERSVLLGIARRIHGGQDTYGELDIDGDKRDWEREGAEELEDFMVYREIARLKRRREG